MVKLFVEGGGDDASLKTECRRAFSTLLEKAGFKGRMPRVVACGDRRNTFEQFCTALTAGEQALLLVDAEGPLGDPAKTSPWDHVAQREGDKWERPKHSTEDQLHLMVECMEAWFLADLEGLKRFYGSDFLETNLPKQAPEKVSKVDLYKALKASTAKTKSKGRYDKGAHSFKLLATLNPTRICTACPWAKRFFETKL
jgi:hypothetical protein